MRFNPDAAVHSDRRRCFFSTPGTTGNTNPSIFSPPIMPNILSHTTLRETALAKQEADARALLKMLAIGTRYPNGNPQK